MGQTYDHCGCKAEKVVDCTDGKWKVEIKEQSAGRPRGYIYHTDRFFVWVMDSGIVWSMVGYDPVKAIHASTFYLSCNTTLRYATLRYAATLLLSEDSLFPLLVLGSKLDSSKTPVLAVV